MSKNHAAPHYTTRREYQVAGPGPPSLLGQNTLLSTPFSNTLSLCSSLSVKRSRFTNTLTKTPMSRVLEKLIGAQLVKFPAVYGTPFITAFTRPRHLSLLWARSIQSLLPADFLNIHFNIILPPMPVSPKLSLSLTFPHQNPVCTSPLPPYVLRAPPISFFLLWSTRVIFGEEYRSLSSSLCSLLHSILPRLS